MKSMKRTILVLGILVGLMGFMSAGAQATVINGTIGITLVGATLDSSTLSAATKITSTGTSILFPGSDAGAYAGATSISKVKTFTFNPSTTSINDFVTFSAGGTNYDFSVTSMNVTYSSTSITISGVGDVVSSGGDTTISNYSITINQSKNGTKPLITLEIDSPAVPEPSTLLLFGTGLLGLGFFGRRKKGKS